MELERFRLRAAAISAFQFDGSAVQAAYALTGRWPEPGAVEGTVDYVRMPSLEGDIIARPRDWIVTGESGKRSVFGDAQFRSTFEPVE